MASRGWGVTASSSSSRRGSREPPRTSAPLSRPLLARPRAPTCSLDRRRNRRPSRKVTAPGVLPKGTLGRPTTRMASPTTARPVCRICPAPLMTSPPGRRLVWAQPSAPAAPPAAAAVAKGSKGGRVTRDSPPSLPTPPPTSRARGAGPLPPPWAHPQAPLSPSSHDQALGPSLLPADPLPTPPPRVPPWPHRTLGMDQMEHTRQSPAHPCLRREGSCPTCRGTRRALSLLLLSPDLQCRPTRHLGAHCILGWVPTPKVAPRALTDLKDHSMDTKVTTHGPPATVGPAAPATAAPAPA